MLAYVYLPPSWSRNRVGVLVRFGLPRCFRTVPSLNAMTFMLPT
ncbi:hypothetical protein ACFPRL_34330 [Pseudoclavibacter helvolus]